MTSSVFNQNKIKAFINSDPIYDRGYDHYNSNHVVVDLHDIDLKFIRARCQASMKQIYHTVDLYYGQNYSATCGCAKGTYRCSHMAAVLIHLRHNISCTDLQNSWLARHPKTVPKRKLPPTDELFPHRQPAYNCSSSEGPSPESLSKLSKICSKSYNNYNWHAKAEPDLVTVDTGHEVYEKYRRLGILQHIVTKKFTSSNDIFNNMMQEISVDQNEIEEISKLTQLQGNSTDTFWHELRKYRPTGSTFKSFLTASKSKKVNKTLYERVSETKDLSGIHQIQHGRHNEETAIKVFEKNYSVKTVPTGLWLAENGFFAATPDALLPDRNACIEVKCPWKYRNDKLDEVLLGDDKYIVSKESDAGWSINLDHEYYHQLQMEMFCTKTTKCYLVVWTYQDCRAFPIEFDKSWENNLVLVKNFFIEFFIPFVRNKLII